MKHGGLLAHKPDSWPKSWSWPGQVGTHSGAALQLLRVIGQVQRFQMGGVHKFLLPQADHRQQPPESPNQKTIFGDQVPLRQSTGQYYNGPNTALSTQDRGADLHCHALDRSPEVLEGATSFQRCAAKATAISSSDTTELLQLPEPLLTRLLVRQRTGCSSPSHWMDGGLTAAQALDRAMRTSCRPSYHMVLSAEPVPMTAV